MKKQKTIENIIFAGISLAFFLLFVDVVGHADDVRLFEVAAAVVLLVTAFKVGWHRKSQRLNEGQ